VTISGTGQICEMYVVREAHTSITPFPLGNSYK